MTPEDCGAESPDWADAMARNFLRSRYAIPATPILASLLRTAYERGAHDMATGAFQFPQELCECDDGVSLDPNCPKCHGRPTRQEKP
jgi:hypothetical protein